MAGPSPESQACVKEDPGLAPLLEEAALEGIEDLFESDLPQVDGILDLSPGEVLVLLPVVDDEVQGEISYTVEDEFSAAQTHFQPRM